MRACRIAVHSQCFLPFESSFPGFNENNLPPTFSENNVTPTPALRFSGPENPCLSKVRALSPSKTAFTEQGAPSMRKNGLCNLFSHCGIYRKIVTIRRKFLYMPAQAGMVMEATSPVLVTDTVAECQSSGGKVRKHRLPKTNLKPLCTSIGPGQATVLILNGPEPYVAALLTKTMASRPLSDAAYLPVMPRRVNWTLHVSLNLRPWHGHVQGALPVPLYSWLSPKASPAPESPAWCKQFRAPPSGICLLLLACGRKAQLGEEPSPWLASHLL